MAFSESIKDYDGINTAKFFSALRFHCEALLAALRQTVFIFHAKRRQDQRHRIIGRRGTAFPLLVIYLPQEHTLFFPACLPSLWLLSLSLVEEDAAKKIPPSTRDEPAGSEKESLAVGGQAVMEGIMMRNGDRLALAVRRPDQSIVAVNRPWHTVFRSKTARLPWLRGFPVLIETMINGIKALNLSAQLAAEADGEPLKPWQLILTLTTALGLAVLLFIVVPHFLTLGLQALSLSGGVEGLSFHLWDGLLKFAVFICYIAAISHLPEIRRVFQYHGAEHKTISAYEQGENPVTPVSASAYSRLHPRCGTTFLLFVFCISILLHAVTVPGLLLVWHPQNALMKHAVVLLFKLLLMVPVSALAYEAIRRAARIKSPLLGAVLRGPGLLLQTLTTREPDQLQLEVGLVALREALGSEAVSTIAAPDYHCLAGSEQGEGATC